MAVQFSVDKIAFNLKNKSVLKKWILAVAEAEKFSVGNLNYIFTSDKSLLKLNVQFLNHNTFTDIITFNYNEGKKISGDIFISVDRVKENAKKFDVNLEEELHRVMIHGVLHLCGYKDKTSADSDIMRKKENASLRLLKSPKKG